MTYDEWIAENVPTNAEAYGHCEQVTEKMVAAFPELKRVKGHYYCLVWGERGHWWCVAPDGAIVDPTKIQFPSKGAGQYVELDPDAEQPIGLCLNCGGECYASQGGTPNTCSKECDDAAVADLNASIRGF